MRERKERDREESERENKSFKLSNDTQGSFLDLLIQSFIFLFILLSKVVKKSTGVVNKSYDTEHKVANSFYK